MRGSVARVCVPPSPRLGEHAWRYPPRRRAQPECVPNRDPPGPPRPEGAGAGRSGPAWRVRRSEGPRPGGAGGDAPAKSEPTPPTAARPWREIADTARCAVHGSGACPGFGMRYHPRPTGRGGGGGEPAGKAWCLSFGSARPIRARDWCRARQCLPVTGATGQSLSGGAPAAGARGRAAPSHPVDLAGLVADDIAHASPVHASRRGTAAARAAAAGQPRVRVTRGAGRPRLEREPAGGRDGVAGRARHAPPPRAGTRGRCGAAAGGGHAWISSGRAAAPGAPPRPPGPRQRPSGRGRSPGTRRRGRRPRRRWRRRSGRAGREHPTRRS